MEEVKGKLNRTSEANSTNGTMNISVTEYVHDIGALISLISVLINGLLLICILLNRNKSWFRKRREFSVLISLNLAIGLVVTSMFAARRATNGAASELLLLIEEAMYFTSKCLTINYLLVMCMNKILSLNNGESTKRQKASFYMMNICVWLTTLSWLVLPFILLSNECSILWFAGCAILEKSPLLMMQFLAFVFGFPLVVVHILAGANLFLIFKRNYDWKRRQIELRRLKVGSPYCGRNIRRPKAGLLDEKRHSVLNKSLDFTILDSGQTSDILPTVNIPRKSNARVNFYKCDPFIRKQEETKTIKSTRVERTKARWAVTTTLLLLVLDISIWSVVVSFAGILFKAEVSFTESTLILAFLSQVANPVIYITTIPNLRETIKNTLQRSMFSGKQSPTTGKRTEIRYIPRKPCRFSTGNIQNFDRFCNCQSLHIRRCTTNTL